MKDVVNWKDVKPERQAKGFMRRLCIVGKHIEFSVVESEPGAEFEVSHPSEEVLYVLSGKVQYTLPSKVVLTPGMAKINHSNEVHAGRVIGNEPCVAIEIKSPPLESLEKSIL